MGDVSPPSSSPNDKLGQEAFQNSFAESTFDGTQKSSVQTSHSSNSGSQPHHQHHFDPSQNAFSAQFDMTQSQGVSRGTAQGSYNMSAMANALPQPAFRPAAYNGGQARYNDGTSSGPQSNPYVGQSHMNHLAGQQYYMAHNAPMPTYYNTQLPHSQQQTNMAPRHNMNFYPNQGMLNHAQQQLATGYYYPHPSHYENHNSAMSGNMLANQYMSHDPRGHSPTTYQGQHRLGVYCGSEGGFGRAFDYLTHLY